MSKEIKPEKVKLHILKKRMEVVWQLKWEGYSDIEIGDIIGMDRTWVFRLLQKRPRGWKPTLEKLRDLK